jgi:hypothetical protein
MDGRGRYCEDMEKTLHRQEEKNERKPKKQTRRPKKQEAS